MRKSHAFAAPHHTSRPTPRAALLLAHWSRERYLVGKVVQKGIDTVAKM